MIWFIRVLNCNEEGRSVTKISAYGPFHAEDQCIEINHYFEYQNESFSIELCIKCVIHVCYNTDFSCSDSCMVYQLSTLYKTVLLHDVHQRGSLLEFSLLSWW